MIRPLTAIAGSAIGAALGISLAVWLQPSTAYPQTITCQRIHVDDLAPEAIAAIDRLRWSYPAERIVMDADDGTVRNLPVGLVPPPCNVNIQEDEILIVDTHHHTR